MGLILDSSIVIAAERRGDTVEQLIERIVTATGDKEAALSAIANNIVACDWARADSSRNGRGSCDRYDIALVLIHFHPAKNTLT